MAILSKDRIALQTSALNKVEAIRKAGNLLVKTGCTLPEYIEGMLTREQSMSTSLGNGIAIPHGVFENRSHIKKAGISVLQLAEAIEWDKGGKKVHLVIAIAALSGEHVGVLTKLAGVMDNKNNLTELFTTTDPNVILNYLNVQ
jgi:mannitol/fructose-specific phosphotransferase system IIA component